MFKLCNPKATSEAQALYQKFQSAVGSHIFSGQESLWCDSPDQSFPTLRDQYIYEQTQRYPAIFSCDFGDFKENQKERSKVIDLCLNYAQKGSIIMLSNHLVQPDQAAEGGFETMHGFSESNPYPSSLLDEILDPGSELNREHLRRLDECASLLKLLKEKNIPVLWRPYHEMNGDWFWWCGQKRYRELWIQMWEHFTFNWELNHLIWVFSANYYPEQSPISKKPSFFYPGDRYCDLLGVDVYKEYGHEFSPHLFRELNALGGGKPVGITENGEMPDYQEFLRQGQNYVFWCTWFGFEGPNHGNTSALYLKNYHNPKCISL